MASAVDICNLALANLGDSATVTSISPPEGSAQAGHCARFYPMARDALLEMHPWSFAIKRVALAETGTPPDTWLYQYALPANNLKVIDVFPDGAIDDSKHYPFRVQQDGIVTNVEDAVARYIVKVTDTSKFPPLFVNALSLLLASYLAGPMIKGSSGTKVREQMYKQFLSEYGRAAAADANGSSYRAPHTPSWLEARGVGGQLIPDAKIIR